MSITQTFTTPSAAPSRSDTESVFDAKVDARLAWEATHVTELGTWTTQANALETQVNSDAATAGTQAVISTAKAGEALISANQSAASAIASAASAGAPLWVSGTTYSIGDARLSPANLTIYRRITAGAGTTDPSADTTNWQRAIVLAPNAYACDATNAEITLPVGSSTNRVYETIAIDATRQLIIIVGSAAIQAVCYDSSTGAYGTAVAVRTVSGLGNNPCAGILVATDKVLIASVPDSSTAFEAVVLSLSGTAITVNTAATATLPNAAVNNCFCRTAVAAGSSYIFAYRGTTNRAIAITVSGTTPTIGTTLSMAGTPYGYMPFLRTIDSTHVLAVYTTTTNVVALPITVSAGTTLTGGTSASTASTANARYVTALSTGRWAMVYTNTNCMGGIISVSGTVATITTVTLNAAADILGSVVKLGDQLVVQCSTTKINVLTDASGTATAGAAVTTGTLAGVNAITAYGTDYVVFGASGSHYVIKLSGNNPVLADNCYHGTGVVSNAGVDSGIMPDDGPPMNVLTFAGKSALVCPLTTQGPCTMLFGASAATAKLALVTPAYAWSWAFQSPAIMWAGGQMYASTIIRVWRLEMTA